MPTCEKCGASGFFLHLNHSGICRRCERGDGSDSGSEEKLKRMNEEYSGKRNLEIDRLRKVYDFTTIQGIESIPVPCKDVNNGSPTGRAEYYLHKRCFSEYWDAGKIDLAIACLRKANELMFVSEMIWSEKDFMRLVDYLHKAGRHEEAQEEQKKIEERLKKREKIENRLKEPIRSAKYLGTDFVEFKSSGICCGECAMYDGRIFSISGKSERFPGIPDYFKNKNKHNFRCLSVYPYTFGLDDKEDREKRRINNLPLADRRTKEDIERYEIWRKQMEELESKEALAKESKEEYHWIQEHLPDICPKSLSGYSRMKSSNSPNFRKLKEEARNLGMELGGK